MTPSCPPDVALRGRFTPEQTRMYTHLPFTVPPGVSRLHLEYDYSDQIDSSPLLAGGNTLDLGLFDQRGIAAGSPGFRGWSGSAQRALTIAERWATPPYRAGAIAPGTWHVLLGPYKIGPLGLDYKVRVWFNANLPAAPEPAIPDPVVPALPPPAVAGWRRCDLHSHTRYSDGDAWPAALRVAAGAAGLDVLGITDHNSAHVGPYPADQHWPFLMHGVEVTTYGGHWNVWGTDQWHEFREPNQAATAAAMAAAVASGGFVSINHPRPFGPPWEYGYDMPNQGLEVWNGPWDRLNWVSLAVWEEELKRGHRLVPLGGSDTHRIGPEDPATGPALPRPRLGEPTTWLFIPDELTAAGVLAALHAGRIFLSASPAGPQLYVERTGGTLRARVVGAPGATIMLIADGVTCAAAPIARADWTMKIDVPARAGYVRAQVLNQYGTMLALSRAFWPEDATDS